MQKQLISVAVIMLMFAACKTNEPAPASENQTASSINFQTEEGAELAPQGVSPNARASASVRINGDPCGTAANNENCVFYVRCRRTLPTINLTFFEVFDNRGRLIGGKRFIINSTTATVGAAAIIRTSAVWGHIAIVQRMTGSIITIRESNFFGRYVSERSGTAADLGIVGFHR